MKIPKTTPAKPLIEFRINKDGKIKLSASSTWWGGKNSGFWSSNTEGNTCKPEHLKSYINAFKKRKIKDIEKEILTLQKKLEKLKSNIDF